MSALEFEIVEWLGAALDDEIEASTLASLKILAGPDRVPLTEVEDTIARTVRSHIRVPAYSVAQWLLINWWRLRWEPRPDTAILVTSPRPANQRFMLGRLIGTALLSSLEEHVLPISTAGTALQKFQRSFAQELLCPWSDLDAFTDEHGIDDDGIEDAATHFQVSELCVLTTLVNKKKIPRYRLSTGET